MSRTIRAGPHSLESRPFAPRCRRIALVSAIAGIVLAAELARQRAESVRPPRQYVRFGEQAEGSAVDRWYKRDGSATQLVTGTRRSQWSVTGVVDPGHFQPLAADRPNEVRSCCQRHRTVVRAYGAEIPSLSGQFQIVDVSIRCWCLAHCNWMGGTHTPKAPRPRKISNFVPKRLYIVRALLELSGAMRWPAGRQGVAEKRLFALGQNKCVRGTDCIGSRVKG